MSAHRLFAIVRAGVVTDVIVADGPEAAQGRAGDVFEVSHMATPPSPGWRCQNGDFAPPPAFSGDPALIRANAIARVNRLAGAARARHITDVPGQAETYMLKRDELARYDAAIAAQESIDPAAFLLLSTEAAARGISLDAMATMVRTYLAYWLQLAAAIEGLRCGANAEIASAPTELAVLAAIPEDWP